MSKTGVWNCMDCGKDTNRSEEYYMLKDHIWESIVPGRDGMLCLRCVEKRLGRDLHREDFSDAPVNEIWSERCFGLYYRYYSMYKYVRQPVSKVMNALQLK